MRSRFTPGQFNPSFPEPDSRDRLYIIPEAMPDGSTSFTDRSSWRHQITASGNAAHSWLSPCPPQSGLSSVKFDGSGDYLSIPASGAWNLGTGDFEIESRIIPQGTLSNHHIIGQLSQYSSSSDNSRWNMIISSGKPAFRTEAGGFQILGATALVSGKGYTIIVRRLSGRIQLFMNGIQEAEEAFTSDLYRTEAVYIGRNRPPESNWDFNGYIDYVRMRGC